MKKVTAFEQRKISNDLKIDSWQLFLKNWSDDNPYSQQDGELRSMAESRVVHWQQAERIRNLFSERYWFTDWPNPAVPALAAGVYVVWQGVQLIYAGIVRNAD